MLNRKQYLLVKLAEELSEIQKELSKAIIFGIDDEYNGVTNHQKISAEFNDVRGVIRMINIDGFNIAPRDEEAIDAKIIKVEKYMQYSAKRGILDLSDSKLQPI